MNKKSRISQAFGECLIGFVMAVLYIAIKFFIYKTLVLSEAVFIIIFAVIFFFVKGYFWGKSTEKIYKRFYKKINEEREEMYDKLKGLKCYRCFQEINPEEDKCPNCGWAWKI